jgi:hypothetical protein
MIKGYSAAVEQGMDVKKGYTVLEVPAAAKNGNYSFQYYVMLRENPKSIAGIIVKATDEGIFITDTYWWGIPINNLELFQKFYNTLISRNQYMIGAFFHSFMSVIIVSSESPTTETENNYMTKGYRTQLESGLDMKKGYSIDDSRTKIFRGGCDGNWNCNYIFKFMPLMRGNGSQAGTIVMESSDNNATKSFYGISNTQEETMLRPGLPTEPQDRIAVFCSAFIRYCLNYDFIK